MTVSLLETTPAERPGLVGLRRAAQALLRGDLDTLRTLWSPDIRWTSHGAHPVAGTLRGFDAVVAALTGGVRALDAFAVTPTAGFADDECSVGLFTTAATRGGRTAIERAAAVCELTDGQVSAVRWIQGPAAERHAHVRRLRASFDAFRAGDTGPTQQLWADDIRWVEGGSHSTAGTYLGFDAVMELVAHLVERSGGTFGMRLNEALADDETAVATYTNAMTVRGRPVIHDWVAVGDYAPDGRLTRVRAINDRQSALDVRFD